VHQAEAPPDKPGRSEVSADLLRVGISGNVEILRRPADQEVPDRSTDNVGMEAGLAETTHDPNGILVQQGRIYPVLFLSVDVGFLLERTVVCCAVSEKQSAIPLR
jgi:hypothetical protein